MKKITQCHLKLAGSLLFGIGVALSPNVMAQDLETQTGSAIRKSGNDELRHQITGIKHSLNTLQQRLIAETAIRESGDNDLRHQITAINQLLPPLHVVGERYQGGIIFHVDDTGQHGLIAALADQGKVLNKWNSGSSITATGATGDGIGTGRMNTAIAIANQIADNRELAFAAKLAADYRVMEDGESPCTGSATETCLGDWYLPSKVELNLMWFNLADSEHNDHNDGPDDPNNLAGFSNLNYWSSTEIGNTLAWLQSFSDGLASKRFKGETWGVRAIRAF
ncbi:hypothetical protein QZJ86_18965 [Methylomonas montana]|uniref:hypothetical protein n=1 Tax=Methylomonas montana TaxID=3058963 RepID=UPI002658F2A6|nr:hypothetical protein [Methylomonas montana]WKJ90066.1 hypothetical protein QZJ86_18965 [Methylomonas montana]